MVLDDGLFEVVLVKRPVSILELATGIQAMILQTPVEEGSALLSFRASKVTFTCDKPIPWTLDGEYGGNKLVNVVENHSKAITVIQGQ